MTLTVGGRPLGQRLARAWYRLRVPLFASPFYRTMLGGAPVFQLAVAPPDPWPGDADRGIAIMGGSFPLAHEVRIAQGDAIWETNAAPQAWLDELHSFQWLADLRTLGGGAARRRARELVSGWCRRYRWWHPVAWRPPVLARRVAAWLGHYEFFAASADDELRTRFFRTLLRQLRHLDRIAGAATDPLDRLAVIKALVMAGIAMPEEAPRLRAGMKRLEQCLAQDFLVDGGHVLRSPAAQADALRQLVDIRAALGAAGRRIPENLQSEIELLAGVVRFMRHGDGGLALFHDSTEDENWLIDTLLAHAVPRASLPLRLPQSGFERMQAGRAAVIVDVGGPPPAGLDHRAHASALAFEMSIGKERLIVNCGAGQRGTAAHSALTVEDADSAKLRRAGGVEPGAGQIATLRQERDGAVLVDARHDFYAKRFGVEHRRRLYLASGGDDLRGEDTLTGAAGRSFAVRFHLHPEVSASLLKAGTAALLRLPGGQGWRLRAAGASMRLEDSEYSGVSGETKRSRQVVLAGTTAGAETVVKWALQREGRKP